ncbi:Exodeoxyribonuclease VII large subunit [Desulforamulus reducens MI-1]|uniref:Exodeoxyribonuclease 7 large subunit n=1 Tax=Desulforamulus reducens (strain ATCC BAA-1160 / DSM 100696 / MI-1) TaxID=349161 RepID=A4J3F4_DESRM|nr:exodeoxyribonuclease VII large subunit [Desulforamulus reducens]ABO49607.1 Exodeoxyribonuclease VII large subunit [Desulforamulus reducens MI-1]
MKILSVSDLTKYIKRKLESDSFLANIWVKGEISNLKLHSSGHIYLTLKDKECCLKVVMFRSRARGLVFRPENGMSVIIQGYLSVYERDGSYQLYAEAMEPDGVGALYIALEQLKQKLSAQGYFDKERKRPIPRVPKVIGIVTSPTGAAIQDMLNIIGRRWPNVHIIVAPVLVQGEGAANSISRGIIQMNHLGTVDVIIVGRGGGSLEELWAFNTEAVAMAIVQSKIPVISAVGHETDFTVADMVADLRAPTPSAAAELVVPDGKEMSRYLETLEKRLAKGMGGYLERAQQRVVKCLAIPSMQRPFLITGNRQQTLDTLTSNLYRAGKLCIADRTTQLANLAGKLNVLSPLATLSRGYGICTTTGGEIVSDTKGVAVGQTVQVVLHKGKLLCQVEEKTE